MKDLIPFALYVFIVSVPTVCAAYVASSGHGGWGWFLAMTLVILCAVTIRVKV